MKNKKYLIKILSVVLAIIASSCDTSILDVKNETSYNSTSYFKTPTEVQQSVNAAYASFMTNEMFGWRWGEIFDVLAEESFGAPSANGETGIQQLWRYEHNNTNEAIYGAWHMLYKMIMRSNLTIDKANEYITKNGDDAAKITSYSLGQAYFLRGWAYSQLAFYWGRVPIRKGFDQTANIDAPRSTTVDEVWAVAEADFKIAQTLLPESYSSTEKGRATKFAATGFLGKLYLYTKKNALADAEFAKLDGKFTLLPASKWDDNFGETGENNSESVFEVQFAFANGDNVFGISSGGENSTSHTAVTWRPQLYSWTGWSNWKFQPRRVLDFQYSDEQGTPVVDPRAKLTFYGGIGDGTWCDNCPGGVKVYDFVTLAYWYRKGTNRENKVDENSCQSGNNVRLMRYADVLLMRAECKLQLGDNAGCLSLINQVRKRIGAFEYSKTYSKDELFNILMRERQLELMGEAHRYNDLVRWGKLKEVINPELQAQFGKQNITDQHYLFPIPQAEIDTNLGLGSVNNSWN
jgi:starch-binding outer membrane protein, SusD/RagB family